MKDKVYVIDTSGFISHMDFRDGTTVTVPAVVDEIMDSTSRLRFDLLKDAGLIVELPDGTCREKVKSVAISTGDASVLSATDLDILAKALELKIRSGVVLVTDDYAVQNVAANLGIEYKTAATSGIKKKVVWELQCTGCGNVWEPGKTVKSGRSGKAVVSGKAARSGKSVVSDKVARSGKSVVSDKVARSGKSVVSGKAARSGKSVVSGKVARSGKSVTSGNVVESVTECPICGSDVRRRRTRH